MSSLFLLLIVAIFVAAAAATVSSGSSPHELNLANAAAVKNRVMVWLCLEFCEETQDDINANLDTLRKHKNIVSAASFEKYTLGPNSSLVDNQYTTYKVTPVSAELAAIGFETWPLLSSFPHPPEFIDWMRYVFENPDPFINSCISESLKYGYFGWNLDWEPTDSVTAEDGNNYAKFISYFADKLHANNLKLSVDIATWSSIWNYTAIAATSVDYGISMGTYTSSDSSFSSQLDKVYVAFGSARTGVGLETVNASTEGVIPLDEVTWRFDEIIKSGAKEVDLWKMPVPEGWWPILANFVFGNSKN